MPWSTDTAWYKGKAWHVMVWHTHRKRPDLLRDASRFRPSDLGRSKRVEESGLSVVHVSHDADHRRSWREAVKRRLRYLCSTEIAALTGETVADGNGMGWDGTGRVGVGCDVMGSGGMGWDGSGWVGIGWDGAGRDGTGRDGMGCDGLGMGWDRNGVGCMRRDGLG